MYDGHHDGTCVVASRPGAVCEGPTRMHVITCTQTYTQQGYIGYIYPYLQLPLCYTPKSSGRS